MAPGWDEPNILDWFQRGLSATAVDMESAAAGGVCAQAGAPFLVVRTLSDQAPELARWDWAGLARSRKGGRLALAFHFTRHPALASRLWRLQRDMARNAQGAARLVTSLLNKP